MADDPGIESRSMNRIGGVLAVLMTLAIVAVVFWQARPGGDSQPADPVGAPGTRQQMPADIEAMGDNMWRASAGPAFVFVRGNPATDFEFRVRMFMMIDDDTRLLLRAQRTLIQDPNAAAAIDLSDDQMARIKSIEPPRMVIADDDRERFISAWHAWEKADEAQRPAARDAVLDLLRKTGEKNLEPTKKAWAEGAQAFKKILTLQQMAKLAVYQEKNGGPTFGGPFGSGPTSRRR